jgi:hypothetical protein
MRMEYIIAIVWFLICAIVLLTRRGEQPATQIDCLLECI